MSSILQLLQYSDNYTCGFRVYFINKITVFWEHDERDAMDGFTEKMCYLWSLNPEIMMKKINKN